jgi:hypothetical protein
MIADRAGGRRAALADDYRKTRDAPEETVFPRPLRGRDREKGMHRSSEGGTRPEPGPVVFVADQKILANSSTFEAS